MKKLNLNRETIRNLDMTDLGEVHGGTGEQHTVITGQDNSCDVTACTCTHNCPVNTNPYCINTLAPVC